MIVQSEKTNKCDHMSPLKKSNLEKPCLSVGVISILANMTTITLVIIYMNMSIVIVIAIAIIIKMIIDLMNIKNQCNHLKNEKFNCTCTCITVLMQATKQEKISVLVLIALFSLPWNLLIIDHT